jgi:Peptidase family M48
MTSALTLGLLLACSALTIATAVGWTAAACAFHLLSKRRIAATTRARLFAQVRLLPLACVAVIVPVQVSGFLRHEAGIGESAGALLWTTAIAGVLLALHALWCAATTWRETARVIGAWKQSATPLQMPQWSRRAWTIQPPSPVVAVAGFFRPELFVASRVVATCSRDELAAIAAHEAAHVAARDNLVRWLFRLTPGAGLLPGLAGRLEREWAAAAEETADGWATRAASALDLASALTKVARLSSSLPAQPLIASALIDGSPLEARVRRLLEASTSPRRHPTVWLPTVAVAVVAVIGQSAPVLPVVHELFELLVRR